MFSEPPRDITHGETVPSGKVVKAFRRPKGLR